MGEIVMRELQRLLRAFRFDSNDPAETFAHRMRIGMAVALLILTVFFFRGSI